MKFNIIKNISLAFGLMLSTAASAGPLLWVSDVGGNLGTVDVANGNVNVIGGMGTAMMDIAFDSQGNLYGISSTSLFSINTITAAVTEIGNGGHGMTGGADSLVFSADGTLYAAGTQLYTLNISDGSSSVIGGGAYDSSGDLAFINGELYLSSLVAGATDKLVKIDVGTGNGTDIGDIGYSVVYGLATDNNVNLYGLSGTNVLAIDALTGAGSVLVNYAGKGLGAAYGSAFYGESGAVPEPATIFTMALGLLGLRAFTRARKTC